MKHSHSFIKHISTLDKVALSKLLNHHYGRYLELTDGLSPDDLLKFPKLMAKAARHLNRVELVELELKHRGLS